MSRLTDLFKGLMFLEGHFTRPDDLADLSTALGNRAASDRWLDRKPDGSTKGAGAHSLLGHLQYLGGRPMHAGHNLDIDEPFEQLAANDDSALRDCAACG